MKPATDTPSAWFVRWMRLAPPHILVEQLRLIYASTTASIAPMFPAVVLLIFTLYDSTNLQALLLWALVLAIINIYLVVDARAHLRRGIAPDRAPALVVRLMVLMALGGLAWGLLAWVALGKTTLAGSVLVIAVLAGILGGAVGLLSPLQPVFAALALLLVGTTVARLWQLNDPAYHAFGVISLMYMGVLVEQSRTSSRAVRAAIQLSFDNVELLAQADAARHEAEQSNTAKSRFLAAASHDLRQPIHAQGLFLEVLSNTPLSAQQRELVNNVRDCRNASTQMLNVLLDFSRIEANVIEPQVHPFRMQLLLNKLEREFGPQADAKGLAYRSRDTWLVVQSDPQLVELVLRNFIANAIRYTERGGVLVTCRPRGGQALLQVWDTGIGIAPSQQQEVFREFHQLANPERDNRKGLGLGLAIADGLARTMGHTLTLRSTEGRGSVFSLALPVSSEPLPAAQAISAGRATAVFRLPDLRVLLIDDEPTIRTGMYHLLRSWGCVCEAVESIDEALALAPAFAPQVLVSDYRLRQQRTGAQAVAALRGLLGPDLPCLIITGDTAPERLREAMASGVPLLHKPVVPQQLYEALAAIQARGNLKSIKSNR